MSAAGPAPAPQHATADLTVEISNLRNAKGKVRACLTRADDFLDCSEDPDAFKRSVGASEAKVLRFDGLEPGRYYLLLLHDENANGRLDLFTKIPKEGFGFSNNPKIRMGPPRGRDVAFELPAGESVKQVRMKYIL